MRFTVMADTDIGRKRTNQDSLIVKHAESRIGEVVMAEYVMVWAVWMVVKLSAQRS